MKYILFATAILLSAFAHCEGLPTHFRSYHVGNSLTWDMQPTGVAAMANQRGTKHTVGYHVMCGKPLRFIWENPDKTCVKPANPFGTFRTALSKHQWDAVTIQPYPGATLADDVRVILDIINLTRENPQNGKTRFYVYAAWPQDHGKNYQTSWTRETVDAGETKSVLCRSYFKHLLARVNANTDAPVTLIPAGEVLYQLDKALKAKPIDGLKSAADLYRDRYHLSYDRGRFAVALTAFSTLLNTTPRGVSKPDNAYGKNARVFTPAYYDLLSTTIRNVLVLENSKSDNPRK